MAVTSKLLNDDKFSNTMKNKYCIVCVKNYLLKIMETVAVGILQSRNFGKYSMLFLGKHHSIFREGYYSRKNDIFPFTEALPLISFFKNPA